jgi:hypothetical protein
VWAVLTSTVFLSLALSAARLTGVTLDDLDDLLSGQPTVRFQFDYGDT